VLTSTPTTAATATAATRVPISPGHLGLIACVRAAAHAIVQHEADLNDLDAKAGDGDCGTTLTEAANALLARFQPEPRNESFSSFGGFLAAIADALMNTPTFGGSSGAIYQIGLTAAAAAASASASSTVLVPTAAHVLVAIQAATTAIQHYGGAQPGDRTMLDALAPLLALSPASCADPAAFAIAAAEGADRTATMPARAGRASYLNADQIAGVPDAGARAVALWIAAVVKAL